MKNNDTIEQLNQLIKILDQNIQVFRSAGEERKEISLWEYDRSIDILGRIDIIDSAVYGAISRSVKSGFKNIQTSEILELENLDPFFDEVFLNWFINYRHKYPKIILSIITTEYSRRLFLKIIKDNI